MSVSLGSRYCVEGAEKLKLPPASSLVAIGNFDGVHRGHQAVLGSAFDEADRRGLKPLVLTFHPHPSEVLGRGALPLLTALERKVELIARLADDVCVVAQPFDLTLAAKKPVDFVEELLVRCLGAAVVIVGRNFRFGHRREGDLTTLAELGQRFGFEARAEALVGDEVGCFSSTRVRDALSTGDVREAASVLGRPHMLTGRVEKGDQRGRSLGFPTANLGAIREALPEQGVYAALVDVEEPAGGFRRIAGAVMNVGSRPTFAAGSSVEAHLLDFEGDLYGRRLRAHLVERLRAEQRFDGVDALRRQIELDAARGREILAGAEPDPRAGEAWY